MAEQKGKQIDQKFEFFIRKRFNYIPENEHQQMIMDIKNWISSSNKFRKSLRDFLDYAARTMYRLFKFKEISIGVKDQNDGLYRYVTVIGFTKKAEKAQRAKTYTFDEISDYEKYQGIKLSATSDFCVADEMKEVYNRPLELYKDRALMEEFAEGDYIDISIYDSESQLIGWIELANPIDGKIPTKETLLLMELFASILGVILEREILSEHPLKI